MQPPSTNTQQPSPTTRQPLLDPGTEPPSAERCAAAWQDALNSEYGAFRGAFEYAAIGMALVGLDGRFLKVNRSLCRSVGYTADELQSLDFQSITHPEDLDADLELTRKLIRGECDHFQMEKRYLHKQGHVVWIQLSASLVRDEAQQPLYAVSQIEDITARKAAEAEAGRRHRHVERLTRIVARVIDALENSPRDATYANVLQLMLEGFQSQAGLFLRATETEVLAGPYLLPPDVIDVRCLKSDWPLIWHQAIAENRVIIDTMSETVCGKPLARSLVAPVTHREKLLGLFHLGNSPLDYDEDDRQLIVQIGSIIAPLLAARIARDRLSPREAEVMDLIIAGRSQKQIATELNITIQTAAKHRARVLDKLKVNNDVELVRLALKGQSA